MCACVCVPESAYYGQRWKEKMRNWGAGDEEKTEHRENNLIVELDGCSSSFLSFICFLFPLLIFLPPKPPSISPNSLMASISEGVFACAHMHLRCFQMWFIRSEQQLVLMCGGLLMIGFILTQVGDWCCRPAASTHHSIKKGSLKNIRASWTAFPGKRWRIKTTPLGLHYYWCLTTSLL